MSTKGKEKAGSDSDSDSDTDFFTYKQPKRTTKQAAPTAPIRTISSSPDYDSGETDSDDPDAKKRRKRKRKASKPPPQPTWLDVAALAGKGRATSRSTEREGSKSQKTPILELEASEDEEEKLRRKRERIVAAITPPPMLSASEKQALKAMIDDALPMEFPEEKEEEHSSSPSHATLRSSPDRAFEPDEKVSITIRMVVDPERKAAGISEKAIARYEKPWAMFVNRRDPLARMLGDLADKISKDVNELVVEYKGAKLLHSFTPLKLGIQAGDEVEMLGYELAVYEKVLKERAAKREGLDTAPDDGDAGDEDEEEGDTGEVPEEEAETETTGKKGTILRLRGKWGEATIRVADNISVKLLAGYYCKKRDHVGSENDVQLEFDGDKLDAEMLVGDLGVEDRDMIDVICP